MFGMFVSLFSKATWRVILTILQIIIVILAIFSITTPLLLLIWIPAFLILGAMKKRSVKNSEKRIQKQIDKHGVDVFNAQLNELNNVNNMIMENADLAQRQMMASDLNEIKNQLYRLY